MPITPIFSSSALSAAAAFDTLICHFLPLIRLFDILLIDYAISYFRHASC